VTAVVDTNIVAYYVLGTERFATEARHCLENLTRLLAPACWEAELANVLWMAVGSRVLPSEVAPRKFALARMLGVEPVPVETLCHGALARSIATGLAVYDTLFVELAVRTGCPLVTFDKSVLKAYPGVALRPGAVQLPMR
jgi:predicted nucleic acid-binding protein